MAGINAEAEQREQLITETEQRIADLKQQVEKVMAQSRGPVDLGFARTETE